MLTSGNFNHLLFIRLYANMILLIVSLFIFNVEALMNLTEGSECFINGHKGKCVGAKSCESFNLVDLEKRQLLLSEICSHNNIEVVICCLDCKPFTRDYRDSTITGDGYIWKNGKKSWDKCVEYLGKKEFNCKKYRKLENMKIYDKEKKCFYTEMFTTGTSWIYSLLNRVNSATHIAFLEYGDKSISKTDTEESAVTDSGVTESSVTETNVTESVVTVSTITSAQCAGSIISERFILTAAQCANNAELDPVTYVLLGFEGIDNEVEKPERYKVKRFIQHPEYKPTASYHDIALIETEIEIVFNYVTKPICLLDDSSIDENYGKIFSWESESKTTGKKTGQKYINVIGYNPARCSFRYSEELAQGVNSTLQACYMDPQADPSCEGVPGLPMEIVKPLFSCARFLGAVTSYNRTCKFKDGIGLFTRVQSYIPWIEEIVWPEVSSQTPNVNLALFVNAPV